MRLHTFGGLWIDGLTPRTAPGPRPMALLALVAAGGDRGASRDRAVGLLWSEASQDLARHALSQTLYRLKHDLGVEGINAGQDLRLAAGLSSDVGDFTAALAVGHHRQAAELYTGPFLDGFYLPGAPEFERWVDEERERLRRAALRAMEHAATAADHGADRTESLRWWRRLTELDPLSARYAAGLMHALAAAGDRDSALDHARRHAAIVRRELQADPDPAIQRLESSLRAGPSAPSAPATPSEGRVAPAPKPTGPEGQPIPGPGPAGHRRRVPRWVPAALALLVVVAAVAVSFDRPAPPFLAVGTIRTPEAGDTGSAGLILRDMLATTLGGLEGLRVVANSRLVELTPPALADEPRATADAARRAGATELIEGELSSEAGTLILTLRRVELGRGVVRKGYRLRADNRYALVDSAVATMARDLGLAPPSLTVREVRTTSPEAYLLYNEGLRAYYSFDASGAYRLMNAALERDSTFAMAAYYTWLMGLDLADPATRQRQAALARRLANRTIERERLLIQAGLARQEGPIAAAAAIAETLTVRYPAEPDGFITLGLVRHGRADFAGAVASFARAVAIDSAAATASGPFCRMCLALEHMAVAYIWWDSAVAAERVGRQLLELRPDDPRFWVGLIEPLLRQARRSEAELVLERSGLPREVLEHFETVLNRDRIRWGQYEEIDRRLLSEIESPTTAARGDARWLLMISLRDQGRFREAWALGQEGRIPGTSRRTTGLSVEPILSATLWQEMNRPDSAARLLHERARQTLGSTELLPGVRARYATWYLTLSGTAYAAADDTAAVRRLADSTERLGKESTFGRDALLHHYLRGLLLQREARHEEAVQAFRRALFSPTDGYTRINLAMARSLLALRRPDEAIAVLRPAITGGVDGSNTYTSRTELHEAMALAFDQAGRRDSAAAHWRAVEQAWRRADPELLERYRRAVTLAGPRGPGN